MAFVFVSYHCWWKSDMNKDFLFYCLPQNVIKFDESLGQIKTPACAQNHRTHSESICSFLIFETDRRRHVHRSLGMINDHHFPHTFLPPTSRFYFTHLCGSLSACQGYLWEKKKWLAWFIYTSIMLSSSSSASSYNGQKINFILSFNLKNKHTLVRIRAITSADAFKKYFCFEIPYIYNLQWQLSCCWCMKQNRRSWPGTWSVTSH